MLSTHRAIVAGSVGMAFVGGSVVVSGVLAEAPFHTAQALRYAIACVLLAGWARMTGRALHRPRGAEWWWLIGVALTGLVAFNIALVQGSRHAEPAVLAVAVACVPIALAVLGPVLEGRAPRTRVLAAAAVVSTGAAVVEGFGRSDAVGLLWAFTVFAAEAGFTLLAVPVLKRHGPEGVSVHTTWIGAAIFAVLGIRTEGLGAALALDRADILAIGYLAVGVTAVAFILWYSCVRTLGAGPAGLLTGVAPVTAALTGVAVTGAVPGVPVWAGTALIVLGLAAGLHARPPDRTRRAMVIGTRTDLEAGRPISGGGVLRLAPPAHPAEPRARRRPHPRPPPAGGDARGRVAADRAAGAISRRRR